MQAEYADSEYQEPCAVAVIVTDRATLGDDGLIVTVPVKLYRAGEIVIDEDTVHTLGIGMQRVSGATGEVIAADVDHESAGEAEEAAREWVERNPCHANTLCRLLP